MEREKKLLVVVDMQNDFIGGALGTQEAQNILPAVRARIADARKEGEEVAFTRDTHGEEYLSTQEGKNLPVPHCIAGTAGHEIAAGLCLAGERVFDKPAFGSIELAAYVKERGFAAVELVGVCTDICVISNALLIKAFCPEAEVCVRAGCCAGVTAQSHQTALAAMRACQVKIL
ncbi:MAG TPA: cysteine hydrolase [Candidatus Borkfalkia faecavium]|uniref:Cysteine hydrolase n=1 Tax=Candidatus Borkfalkia faecavium TaxID=2838508 RepID=A0A9D2AV75_9FIRM|nr:cysteine hydrolase [Candidatus Borkfalkia faecavium]